MSALSSSMVVVDGDGGSAIRRGPLLPAWMEHPLSSGKLIILRLEVATDEGAVAATDDGENDVVVSPPSGSSPSMCLPKNPFIIKKSIDQLLGGSGEHSIEGAFPEKRGLYWALKVRRTDHAAKLIKNMKKLIDGTAVRVIPHPILNVTRAVVTCPEVADTTEQELKLLLQEQDVLDVRRFTRRTPEGRVVPTPSLQLTINGTIMPRYIEFGYIKAKTRHYYPNPLVCFQCYEFGHTRPKCNQREQTCGRCSATYDPDKESHYSCSSKQVICGGDIILDLTSSSSSSSSSGSDNNNDDEESRDFKRRMEAANIEITKNIKQSRGSVQSCNRPDYCSRCKTGAHFLASRKCPVYVREQEIQRIKVHEGLPYPAAKKLYDQQQQRSTTTTTTTAAVVSKKGTTIDGGGIGGNIKNRTNSTSSSNNSSSSGQSYATIVQQQQNTSNHNISSSSDYHKLKDNLEGAMAEIKKLKAKIDELEQDKATTAAMATTYTYDKIPCTPEEMVEKLIARADTLQKSLNIRDRQNQELTRQLQLNSINRYAHLRGVVWVSLDLSSHFDDTPHATARVKPKTENRMFFSS